MLYDAIKLTTLLLLWLINGLWLVTVTVTISYYSYIDILIKSLTIERINHSNWAPAPMDHLSIGMLDETHQDAVGTQLRAPKTVTGGRWWLGLAPPWMVRS